MDELGAPIDPQDQGLSYARSQSLPGIEALRGVRSTREWHLHHEQFEIVTIYEATSSAWYRHQSLSLRNNIVCAMEPGNFHRNFALKRPNTFHVLFISFEQLDALLQATDLRAADVHFGEVLIDGRPDLMAKMRALDRGVFGDAEEGLQEEAVTTAIVDVIESFGESGTRRRFARQLARKPCDRAALGLRELIEYEPTESVSLARAQRELGVDRFTLIRSFKKRFGITPYQYQLQLRILKSREQLREGKALVEVAADCGFSDQSHFHRHFKRAFGVTPAYYRARTALG